MMTYLVWKGTKSYQRCLQKQKYQLFLMLHQIWSIKLWSLLCIQVDFVFQKSHTFIMMIFHARTKPYTSAMEKADLTVILCLQTGRLKYWQNTGFNVAGQEGFCSQVHGQGIILQKIVSFSFSWKRRKSRHSETRLHTLFTSQLCKSSVWIRLWCKIYSSASGTSWSKINRGLSACKQ